MRCPALSYRQAFFLAYLLPRRLVKTGNVWIRYSAGHEAGIAERTLYRAKATRDGAQHVRDGNTGGTYTLLSVVTAAETSNIQNDSGSPTIVHVTTYAASIHIRLNHQPTRAK